MNVLARTALIAAALTIPLAAASAQSRPPRSQPAKPAAAPEPEGPPPIFPCRTAEEICYLGVVVGTQVAVIYTNAQNAEGIDAKPIDVMGADGAKMDMSKNVGRVVMLTGTFDPKTGLTKGEVVEVAGPLLSMSVKAQLGGGDEAGGAPAGGGSKKPPAKRR